MRKRDRFLGSKVLEFYESIVLDFMKNCTRVFFHTKSARFKKNRAKSARFFKTNQAKSGQLCLAKRCSIFLVERCSIFMIQTWLIFRFKSARVVWILCARFHKELYSCFFSHKKCSIFPNESSKKWSILFREKVFDFA